MLKELMGRETAQTGWTDAARVVLPPSLLNRTPTVYEIGGSGVSNVPLQTAHFNQTQEATILQDLIVELHDKYKHNVKAAIQTRRDVNSRYGDEAAAAAQNPLPPPRPPPTEEKPQYVIIGAGHAARIRVAAVEKGLDTHLIVMPNVTRSIVDETKKKLTTYLNSLPPAVREKVTVIFAGLDNNVFINYTDEVEPGTGTVDQQGNQHFPGVVKVAGEASFRRLAEAILPVVKPPEQNIVTVILTPIPRFLNGSGCCQDPEHVVNIHSEEFREEMLKGLAVGEKCYEELLPEK